jgi:hypothetical protein
MSSEVTWIVGQLFVKLRAQVESLCLVKERALKVRTWERARSWTMNPVVAAASTAGCMYIHMFIYVYNALLYMDDVYVLCVHIPKRAFMRTTE